MQRIITGDILAFARHYKGPRFHAIICDPPYHLTSIAKVPLDHSAKSGI
jgi:tRNA1(Val) A37 N6-methylase TrmN6